MTDNLKPCPFCGGEEIEIEEEWCGFGFPFYSFCCNCCEMVVGSPYGGSKERAIKAWNTRKPMDRIVEQLEEAKGKVYIDGKHMYNEDEFIEIDKAIAIVKGVQNE